MKILTMLLSLWLLFPHLALAAGEHNQHHDINRDMADIDCSNAMNANTDSCQEKAGINNMQHSMDHSKMNHDQHQEMNPVQQDMDRSKMQHNQHQNMNRSMDHSQHQMEAIPVSDGSTSEYTPAPFPNAMHMEDDPTLVKVMVNQLEVRDADSGKDNPITWEAEAWIGKDINKLWIKTEGEKVGGNLEEHELQLLYSRAIAPYWDLQTGVRKDFKPHNREWLTLGVKGLAPYFFETDIALFAGSQGRTAAHISAEYEAMLTQKTVLSPEIALNYYGKDDIDMGIGSGLSNINFGLRLRHEFKREFAPYIGVNWSKKFGKTADLAQSEGEKTKDTQFVLGARFWF